MRAYLLEAEHEIKLTDIAKVSVERLHKAMDEFQYCQLVLRATDVLSQGTRVLPAQSPLDQGRLRKTKLVIFK